MRSMQDTSTKLVAAVLAVAAMAPASVAGAASPGQDMRSPDARDAAAGIVASPGQDMRSPDARVTAAGIVASPGQDIRSPDARQPGGTQTHEPFAGAQPGAPAPAADADSWTTPAILGGGLALLVVASAGVVLYSRRHTAPLPR
jgi:hypothetical protein